MFIAAWYIVIASICATVHGEARFKLVRRAELFGCALWGMKYKVSPWRFARRLST